MKKVMPFTRPNPSKSTERGQDRLRGVNHQLSQQRRDFSAETGGTAVRPVPSKKSLGDGQGDEFDQKRHERPEWRAKHPRMCGDLKEMGTLIWALINTNKSLVLISDY